MSAENIPSKSDRLTIAQSGHTKEVSIGQRILKELLSLILNIADVDLEEVDGAEFTISQSDTDEVPDDVGQRIEGLLSLSVEQVDTVLSLISIAENGNVEWWKNYFYIEYLNDGRGYTVTLYGATSATGDLADIFEKLRKRNSTHTLLRFYDTLHDESMGDDVSKLRDLPGAIKELRDDDKDWRGAVWDVYVDLYWNFVAEFCAKTFNRPGPVITTPLVKGFIVDAAINHGPDLGAFQVIFNKMKNEDNCNEKEWFKDFAHARHDILESGFEHLDTSSTGDRCTMWLDLAEQGNWELQRPIEPCDGYWVR